MDKNTLRNSMEQRRAQAAYQDATNGFKQQSKEYVAFVNELPMLIKTNGLGATIAFATYKNDASKMVYRQLENWLKQEVNQYLLPDLQSDKRLIAALTDCSSSAYKAVTVELFAYLIWLRRFAKALDKDA
ncbi:type III-B CRISPR module-associated protein Cmr5 [Haliscomenobacter hydrossis]|uniref:CRISPR type III-B/RAMP module-associated protein Cmr5 n=1 Tax=Haliscomenobacter hydrossis (strain ATCC 27775 / DSM 1100 / LMG 10767 / O) TaxID=760192 RepID=F4L2K1_HALH1|nr:type III-B CRISPR module-associated protein Cmr5 [Haliscomenobacter hydrossis]AEE53919.1 CRISPR-associated protein, Cmr5 family [Haliscomenobacter hydrossis DSM 1100]